MRKCLDEKKAIEMYQQLHSCRAVAEQLGVNGETVRRVLVKNGVPRRKPKKPTDPNLARVSNCRTKYCAATVVMLRTVLDMRLKEITDATGIPTNAASNIISKRGLAEEKPTRIADIDIENLEAEYIAGVSTYALGEKYNVNHATISKWMNRRGHRRDRMESSKERVCPTCGGVFRSTRDNARFCCDRCRWKNSNKRRGGLHDHRSRARFYGVECDSSISLEKLAVRDGNVCQICGLPCDWHDKRWGNFGPLYPSIDHDVSMVNGGSHTWGNVQLAHVICNAIKQGRNSDELTEEVIAHAKEQALAYKCA